MSLRDVTEGETSRIRVQLEEDGDALNGTGLTVSACYVTGVDGQAVDTTGKFGWDVQASGIAYFKPATSDLKVEKSPYRVKFELTDGAGDTREYPNGKHAKLHVFARR